MELMGVSLFAVFVIALALIFDFTNGMHDAANSISTVVSTRVLSPRQAVLWAAFFNFAAFLIFGTGIVGTIATDMVDVAVDRAWMSVILAGLVGAISWNIITWRLGLPSSSSHALIGGFAGAAIAYGGFDVIKPGGWYLTLIFIAVAPLIGMVVGFSLKVIATWVVYKLPPGPVNAWSRILQLFSAAAYSLGHGGNDAQKTMAIIALVLFVDGAVARPVVGLHENLWVVLAAHTAIALGTMSGGWRIVKTMGQKITKLRPIDGVCAETGAAASIFLSTALAVPVSTTHVITGAISGVGAANRFRSVRWNVTIRIVWAWLLTIPMAGIIGALVYGFIKLVT
jgi:inorganic phosphate transporter, PiT family